MQSEVVHQCVVRLPLEAIIHNCSDREAVANFERLVEELHVEDSADAMEICDGVTSNL